MSDRTVTATAWIQVRAERNFTDYIIGAKATRLTQSRPNLSDPDVRMVKVKISLPASAFDPLTASIVVPAEAVEVPEIIGEVDTDD